MFNEKDNDKVGVLVTIPRYLRKRLKVKAYLTEKPMSTIIEELLHEYLKDVKEEV
jgi:predicted DNA-binding protein